MNNNLDNFKETLASGQKIKRVDRDNQILRKQLHETIEQLEQARKARGLVIPERTAKKTPSVFVRLIIGDTHGSHVDPQAIAAVLSDVADIEITEVMMLGDHLECGGWLSGKHTMGYVAEIDETGFEDDINYTNDLLDRLQKISPKITYIEGNHEHRIERWIVDSVQGNKRNAEFLKRQISPKSVLRLDDRGIDYIPQDSQNDMEDRGIIRRGKGYFTHGFSTAKNAAGKTLEKFAGCVYYGHTHRADFSITRLVNVGLVSAWCPGCLCKLSPRWHHSDPTTWNHGYILQIVDSKTQDFQTIHVPIFNGKSYLQSFLKTVK